MVHGVPLDRSQELFAKHLARARDLLPADIRIWDAHTHLGVDEDGMHLASEQLLADMERARISRAFSFPLNDPERRPAYRVPNDRVLEWCAASDGRLVPFCRLDLTEGPVEEAERCLERGARGIKLHPRAQSFTFGEAALDPVFAIAAERSVPILIHAGRGLPPIADDLRALVERHPGAQLILAHAAIADLQQIGRTLLDHPNVVYDTSVWGITDLRALMATVAPEQIVWASDAPYGMAETVTVQMARLLHRAGADERVIRAIFWDNSERVAAGRPAEVLSPVLMGPTETMTLQRMRISDYIVTTTASLWMMQADRAGALGLALRACDANGNPDMADIAELIEAAGALWAEGLTHETPEEIRPYTRGTMRLLQVAMALLHTT
jgi:predicted TIM-barrel fold metal-dependent hydrolase